MTAVCHKKYPGFTAADTSLTEKAQQLRGVFMFLRLWQKAAEM